MTTEELNRDWYSEKYVKEIQVPNLTTWRSRYDLKECLLLQDDTLIIRNLRSSDMIPSSSSTDIQYIVDGAEAYRPDTVAEKVYGDPRLAWVILAANGLNDIFDLTANLEIIIPSSSSLYRTGGVLAK